MLVIDNDEAFFSDHPGRQARIRNPIGDEQGAQFMTLGEHKRDRRRIIAWKVPQKIRAPYREWAGKVVRIPFLAFADEEIGDTDEVLLPILKQIMLDAAKAQGIPAPKMNGER